MLGGSEQEMSVEVSMTPFALQHGELSVRSAPESGILSITDSGIEAPWRIDLTETATVEVRRPGAAAQAYRIPLQELTLRKLGPHHLQWVGAVGGAECAFEIGIEDGAIVFSVTPLGSADADLVSAVWPGAVSVCGEAREVCWSNSQQGALFCADGRPWRRREDLQHTAMRFCGLTSGGSALALIAETPFDACWRFEDDGDRQLSARIEFLPSMGSLVYPRRLRLVPLRESGQVAIAQAFRRYAQRRGLWLSWE